MFGSNRKKQQNVQTEDTEKLEILAYKEELFHLYRRVIEIENTLRSKYGCDVRTKTRQSFHPRGGYYLIEPEIDISKTEKF